jgi:hypothetical protein
LFRDDNFVVLSIYCAAHGIQVQYHLSKS